jgi:hypothetical protein
MRTRIEAAWQIAANRLSLATAGQLCAITGRNFGHYYTESGVDSVISDPSPFLLLVGPTTTGNWRRKRSAGAR